MKFIQHKSSSKANLYEVQFNNGKRIIIEAGLRNGPMMEALGFNIDNILCCLLTHEHKDHSRNIVNTMNNGIDVYSSGGTFNAIGESMHHRANLVADKTLVKLDCGIEIFCFKTHHDCEEPLGFIIRDKDEYLLFATDTKMISQDFGLKFNIIAIECNYDREILKQRMYIATINSVLANRLLTSHMEKRKALKYLIGHCDLSNCTEIHLLHMSQDNIDKESTRKEFDDKLFIKVVTV